MIELRQQLEKERSARMNLEEQVTTATTQFQESEIPLTAVVLTLQKYYPIFCILDAFPGCPVVPREAEGNHPAVPGAAGPNAEPCPSAAAQTAGEGPHSSPQPTG